MRIGIVLRFISAFKKLIRILRENRNLVASYKLFANDLKQLFGHGGVEVLTYQDDKLLIRTVIQADADFMHFIDLEGGANSDVWNRHLIKVNAVVERFYLMVQLIKIKLTLLLISSLALGWGMFHGYQGGDAFVVFITPVIVVSFLVMLAKQYFKSSILRF